jgi:TIR domain
MCLGLAVSLSAVLAQDELILGAQSSSADEYDWVVQKLAQVNPAPMVRLGSRAARQMPNLLQDSRRLLNLLRTEPLLNLPRTEPLLNLPRTEPLSQEEGLRRLLNPPRTEPLPQEEGSRRLLNLPPLNLSRSELLLQEEGGLLNLPRTEPLSLGLGALGLTLAAVGLWLFKRGRAVRQTTVAPPTAVIAATTDGKEGPTVSDIVNCSVFAPPRVARGAKFTVQAHLHVSKDFVKVARVADRIDATANRLGYKQLPLPVPRGANVELFLEFDKDDLIIGKPFRQLKWQGTPDKEVFEVEVPANFVSETIKGLLTLAVDSVPVGDIEFKLHVTTSANVSTEEAAETHVFKYEYAFISYSRKDFRDVSIVAQTLATSQVNLLVDVTELEPGDDWAKELPALIGRADVFYLIWSENASNSEWVDKEARHAKRLYDTSDPSRPRILPITLKRPVPMPPDYLRKFHFDSPWLAQRTAHEIPLFVESS